MTLDSSQNGVLKLKGELGFHSAENVWAQLLAHQGDTLTLDISDVERIDSAGVATLVAFLRHAQESHKEVRFKGASAQLLAMARVSGVDTLLPLAW